jgi:hypothetical protein
MSTTASFLTGTATNLNKASKLDKEENLTGLGILYKNSQTDDSQFLWYNINVFSDRKVKNITSKTGNNQNFWPTVAGKTYKNTYIYINALKDVIVDVMCKCKGKLTSDDLVKQVSKEDVKQLVLGGDCVQNSTLTQFKHKLSSYGKPLSSALFNGFPSRTAGSYFLISFGFLLIIIETVTL